MIARPKIAPSETPAITAGEVLGPWMWVGAEAKGLVFVEGVMGSMVAVGAGSTLRVVGLKAGVGADVTARVDGIIVMKAVVGVADVTVTMPVLECMV